MSTPVFVATDVRDPVFDLGLRSFVEYCELGHSDDVELLEIVMPADFATREVDAVDAA